MLLEGLLEIRNLKSGKGLGTLSAGNRAALSNRKLTGINTIIILGLSYNKNDFKCECPEHQPFPDILHQNLLVTKVPS